MFVLWLFCCLLPKNLNVSIYKLIPPCDDRLYIYEGFVSDIPENLSHDWVYSFYVYNGILNIEISSKSIDI